MAKKREDVAAAKAKKQKIILVVGGVLLLAVGAIQGPKLLKGSSPATEAAPVAETGSVPAPVSSSVSPPAAGSATLVAVSGPRATAVLAGVTIQGSGRPIADTGQLLRFNLFEAKDPFVPQTSDELSGTTETTSEPTLSDTQPGGNGSSNTSGSATSGSATSGSGGSTAPAAAPAAPPAPVTNATIVMNGKPYYVGVKKSFPQSDPLFVLVSLKPKLARIGVAGGTFEAAKTVPLAKGKKVTLVNDATGARYVLKLVYTGAAPEQTESFTQAEK